MRNPHAADRSAGARVYGAGSDAATAGTVDPSGYVGRGLRSGLARSILHGSRRGPDLSQLLGETASRLTTTEVAAMLRARGRRPR